VFAAGFIAAAFRVYLFMISRDSVLRIAASVCAAVIVSVFALLVWLLFFEKVWREVWPAVPRAGGFAAFSILEWVVLLAPGLGVACGAAALVAARRGEERAAGIVPAILICMLAAACYWPFSSMTTERVDRVRGRVSEPLIPAQALGNVVMVTYALCAVFVMVTGTRRTPLLTRQVCRAVIYVLTGLLFNLYVLFVVLPITNGWSPADWERTELLIAFRPCREAVVWLETSGADRRWLPYGRIDGVWGRFSDPRAPRPFREAVSMTSQWQRAYVWATMDDLSDARVRRDDPAVVQCDDRVRTEPVAPAQWHEVGLRWSY
jgi:hypothetical protein